LNIGTNFEAYIPLAFIIVLVIITLCYLLYIIKRINVANKIEDKLIQSLEMTRIFKNIIFFVIFLVIINFAFFFAYGPSNRVTYTKDSGQMKALDEAPKETMTKEELHTDMIEKKDKTGTLSEVANDDYLRKIEKENNQLIQEALQQAKERNK
jgi:hypothetical protein